MSQHTLSVLVEDKPGVLTRVSGLFSRRLFNILSLAVGPTENPGVSRITIVTEGDAHTMEQITKQLGYMLEFNTCGRQDIHCVTGCHASILARFIRTLPCYTYHYRDRICDQANN